jgi:protein Tex
LNVLSIPDAIAKELALPARQVSAAVGLLDEGNTIPFIARYRKEVTGGLDEVQLRRIETRLEYLRKLAERKDAVRSEIESQGKLTPELAGQLDTATSLQAVEDLYRPYKPKRHTRAAQARERGLEPLAQLILAQDGKTDVIRVAKDYLSEQVADEEAALAGARDIIAEQISDDAVVRQSARQRFAAEGFVVSQRASDEADSEGRYRLYYEFRTALRTVQPYQWLALQRGEKDGCLKVRIEAPDGTILSDIAARYVTAPRSPAASQITLAIEDGYDRLLRPAVEREIGGELGEFSDDHAIQVFATNLRALLLQPPLRERCVMGIDPGFRTGCKVVTVDATGKLLHTVVIYPHPPQNEREKALQTLGGLVLLDKVTVIAIGNGTASRESESLAAELIQSYTPPAKAGKAAGEKPGLKGVAYVMVSEAGASVYSASPQAREEFPDLDVSMRGAVSIARRLQDPLAELVKIDPQSIGVGLYQHDVDQKKLAETLDAVVESVVNYVGVDVNTASAALMGYVAGISKKVAGAIVTHRDENGPFQSRAELKKVKGLGPKAYEQAAGFLRVPGGRNLLDNTVIHPESYDTAKALLDLAGLNLRMADLPNRMAAFRDQNNLGEVAQMLGVGLPTLTDIVNALIRPGRDPREDLPAPVLRKDVLTLDDLQEGMVLKGTIRNVVDFGAFVDIGVKNDGLVHVSKMAKKYISNPHEVVHVGDVVDVKVVKVDKERGRVELTMVV